jgi:small-conductance mechanosensitive channel
MHLLGIDWVGVNADNGRKLLLSVIFVAVLLGTSWALRALAGLLVGRSKSAAVQTRFWTRQGISLVTAVVLILGILSIWFNDPTRLATAFGLVSAGLAFALQQVVTSIAGYFVILRGNTFTVGDRISMGGVRGDVMRLGFIQTTIMEMGQPPSVQGADPAMWVHSRQFTGRIVTVSNSKIFAEPVFNYTRDFPFIWEEMVIPTPTPRTVAELKRSCWRQPDCTRRKRTPWPPRRRTSCSSASGSNRSSWTRGCTTALPITGWSLRSVSSSARIASEAQRMP